MKTFTLNVCVHEQDRKLYDACKHLGLTFTAPSHVSYETNLPDKASAEVETLKLKLALEARGIYTSNAWVGEATP